MKKTLNLESFSLAEIFHENTKLHPYELNLSHFGKNNKIDYIKNLLLNQTLSLVANQTQIISESKLECKNKISFKLPERRPAKSSTLLNIVNRRRSIRKFSKKPLSLNELSVICQAYKSNARNNSMNIRFRNIPSAGALYPLEIYVTIPVKINLNIPKGIFYYDSKNHCLTLLDPEPKIKLVEKFILQPEIEVNKCAAIFYIVGRLDKILWKYDNRAYRYMLMEAGHLAQNILLLATSMNVGACPVGGFIDDEVNDYLVLDGINGITMYIIVLGK